MGCECVVMSDPRCAALRPYPAALCPCVLPRDACGGWTCNLWLFCKQATSLARLPGHGESDLPPMQLVPPCCYIKGLDSDFQVLPKCASPLTPFPSPGGDPSMESDLALMQLLPPHYLLCLLPMLPPQVAIPAWSRTLLSCSCCAM